LYFFLFSPFLLAYDNMQCDIYVWYLQCIIIRITFSSFSLTHTPPGFLEQFQQVSFFHFHSWTQNSFSICALPLVPTPGQDLFHTPVLKGFILAFQACVYCALIPLLALSLLPYSPITQQLPEHAFYYLHIYWMLNVSIFFIL
jgi:hypothetical protein